MPPESRPESESASPADTPAEDRSAATPAAADSARRSAPPAPVLSGAQRRHLRGLAHPLKPVVIVGEAGLSDAVLQALDEALEIHELVKVRLRQPEDKKEASRRLAETSGAALCGVVGHTVVLYRANAEKPKIQLPGSPAVAALGHLRPNAARSRRR